ncbi:MAG: THUMP domain-containing protein [Thermoplasmata archaeon]|nr:THUMP domain-containing protein [Thermoplasmata archaeon]
MFTKIFYFKNRDELHKKIRYFKDYFLKNEGEFIYKEQDTKLIIISSMDLEGLDAYLFKDYLDIIKILKNKNFKTFAVRSKRKNSQQENKLLGELILKNLQDKKVNLENPEITIYVDQIKDMNYFYIK